MKKVTLAFFVIFCSILAYKLADQYIFSWHYVYAPPIPFQGDSIVNPYLGIKGNNVQVANFHAHTKNGILNGKGSPIDLYAKYDSIGVDIHPVSQYCKSSAIVSNGLRGALYSPDEMILDSPKAIKTLPNYLEEKYGVKFLWNSHVNHVETGKVHIGQLVLPFDEIYICNGPDFENLFPEEYINLPITKCKLQMMRMGVQPDNWRLGPSLCGGLSLTHYASFKSAGKSLESLKNYIQQEMPEYVKWGIHVMVSQNSSGELIIGDSHEYGLTHDPFDKEFINQYILAYLKKFARFQNEHITHTWNGTYTKMTDGSTELILHPLPGVTVVNGLGGAGMTMALGLTHQLILG